MKCKSAISGFLAGQPTWVPCHWTGKSRPCRRLLTCGALPCHDCRPNEEPIWRGYTPFYSSEYVRLFALITLDYREAVAEIPRHAQIKLSRGPNPRDPLVIVPSLWRPSPLPESADRDYDVDLRSFLLTLWKDSELREWSIANQEREARVAIMKNDDTIHPAGAPAELVNRVRGAQREKKHAEPVPFDVVLRKTPDGKTVIETERRNGKH